MRLPVEKAGHLNPKFLHFSADLIEIGVWPLKRNRRF
jgi:hypothetical protein